MDISAQVLDATAGQLLSAVLDCVGGTAVTGTLPAMKQGGTIVSFGVLGSEPALVRNADLIYRNLTWKGFGVDFWMARNQSRRSRMAHELWDAISLGDLDLPVRECHSLAAYRQALRAARSPATGKVLFA
jgi:NADPH2:quinone reductase